MAGAALNATPSPDPLSEPERRSGSDCGERSRNASQHWILRLGEGGLGVGVGVLVLFAWSTPVTRTAMILGTGQLVLGLGQLVTAAASWPGQRGCRFLLGTAIVSIVFGALVINVIDATEGRLRVAMAIWFVLVALGDLALGRRDSPRRWHLWAAATTAAVGVTLFIGTGISLAALTGIVGGSLLARGVYEVALGLRLRPDEDTETSRTLNGLRHFLPNDVLPGQGYSQVVVGQGCLVMISGQIALDAAGALVGAGSAIAQAGQALTNLTHCLAAAGCDWPDVAKLTCYVTDPAATESFMRALHERLNRAPAPACTVVVVDALVMPLLLVEVEALAFTNRSASPAQAQGTSI